VTAASATAPLVIGRYALFDEIAAGGMATVHLGRLLGPVGFGRTVAIKRLHEQYLTDEEFLTMFMDEARVAARIRHPNVVPMVDVVQSGNVLLLVMDYVHGESLSKLVRAARAGGTKLPARVIAAILNGALLGLHAAHETRGPTGELLNVVHRDVSPQNIIVGADGAARVLDFGIAKAAGRAQITRGGQIKGKLAYMAPEQFRGAVDRRTDVFAASVCLWEALAGKRLHEGLKEVDIVTRVVSGKFDPPSTINPDIQPALDAVVMRGLEAEPDKRFQTARDMAIEIERTVGLAAPSEVSEMVERLAADALRIRSERVQRIEIVAAQLTAPGEEIAPSLPTSAEQPVQPQALEAAPVGSHDEQTSGGTQTTTDTAATDLALGVALPVPARPALKIAVVASLLVALVGLALGGYAVVRRRAAQEGAAPNRTDVAPAAPPPSSMPLPPASAGVPAQAAHLPSPTSSAAVAATPPATGAATAPPVAPPRPAAASSPAARPAPAAPRKDCNPPWTIDENQHKHYKPECYDAP
jgi:serine/threonine-protein kinase